MLCLFSSCFFAIMQANGLRFVHISRYSIDFFMLASKWNYLQLTKAIVGMKSCITC